MKQKNKIELSLSILKLGRLNMINDFTNFEPELYLPIVYSSYGDEMNRLSVEKVNLMWLNFHWKVIQLIFDNNKFTESNLNELFIFFASHFQNLISQFINGKRVENSDLFMKLLNNKSQVINQMIEVGIKHANFKNQLVLQYETEKLLYNKVLKQIQDSYGENI